MNSIAIIFAALLLAVSVECFLLPTGTKFKPRLASLSFPDEVNELLKSRTGEYCFDEVFEAECDNGQTVEVKYAKYGRMSPGRCLNKDEKYIGCSTDVVSTVELFCLGKHKCRIPVNNGYFRRINNCPEGWEGYLDIVWYCS